MKFLTIAAVALLVVIQSSNTVSAKMIWDANDKQRVGLDACERASQQGVLMWVDTGSIGQTRWYRSGRFLYSQRLARIDGKLIAECIERTAE